MFGILSVVYLFLGGAGAGAIVVAVLVDLLWIKEPFSVSSHVSIGEAMPCERVVAFCMLAGLVALVLGVLCLVFDLGRIDRVSTLFVSPSLSFLTIGSFALVALIACAALFTLVRFVYLPAISRGVIVVVEVIAVVIGVLVMVYTGLLLQTLGGVAFWRSPLVPTLFVLSSLSCGIAAVLIAAFFTDEDAGVARMVYLLVRIDAALIVLEVVVAAIFVGLAYSSNHSAVAESARQLVVGDVAALWWVGFVVCGLTVPFVVEVLFGRNFAGARAALAIAAVLVLVGGLSMRASIVDVGGHRALELEEVQVQHTIEKSGAQALGLS